LQGLEVRRRCRDLELTEGLAELALAEAHDALGDRDAARATLHEAHERLTTIAGTIADAGRRERFWNRRAANDRISALARAWG
jgi:hypothetical protein